MNESFNTILKFPFSFILKYFLRNHANYFKFHFCYILKERIVMINTRHHSKGFIYIYICSLTQPFRPLSQVFYQPCFTKEERKTVRLEKSVQFSSVAQSCPTLCDPMNRSTPGLPVHHQLPEFTQTYVYRVGDAIQPSHPLSSPSPTAPNPFQHQSLFQ